MTIDMPEFILINGYLEMKLVGRVWVSLTLRRYFLTSMVRHMVTKNFGYAGQVIKYQKFQMRRSSIKSPPQLFCQHLRLNTFTLRDILYQINVICYGSLSNKKESRGSQSVISTVQFIKAS